MFSRSKGAAAAATALLVALVSAGCDSKVIVTPDGGGPALVVLSPAPNASVSGVGFEVTVDALDSDGVDRVEFQVGDGSIVTDTIAPFVGRLLTVTLAEDLSVSIRVEAFDAEGNSTTVTVPVTVAARILTQLTTDVNDDSHPAWSPDGARIAFQADRDGAQTDLWIMNANGGNATRATTDVNEDRHPAFSPDGAWIAFDSDRAGSFDIWLMPLATGEANAENHTFGNNDDVEPAWSIGGAELFFASSRGAGDFNLFRQDVATGVPTQLTSLASNERAPAVSPDGASLAFASELNFATPHIYTMRLGEVEVLPLTGDIGFTEADPAWSVAGDAILFSRRAALSENLWHKMPDDDVGAAAQVSFGTGAAGDGGIAWHPDGTRLAFHSDRSGNLDIWLME